ncbi:hypothetical protein CL689_02250 [Candidatus Saccharibacteria bacterium]|nr:hypothetical protein [Candidatus Saccharibacteria bacterium]|tara:strand:+ start:5404 stop:5976 length:573 start_codon:yes stop_codon:yes gene_type:complete
MTAEARKPEIHSFDGSHHGDAYDFSMVTCKSGDFVELNNGEVLRVVEGWPVAIIFEKKGNILHYFDETCESEHKQACEIYAQAKHAQRLAGLAAVRIPENLDIEGDNTALIARLPGYTAEVRAVMDGDLVDYLEVYDTESGECLNEGSPIHVWPTTEEELKPVMEMLKPSEHPRRPNPVKKPSNSLKMGI